MVTVDGTDGGELQRTSGDFVLCHVQLAVAVFKRARSELNRLLVPFAF